MASFCNENKKKKISEAMYHSHLIKSQSGERKGRMDIKREAILMCPIDLAQATNSTRKLITLLLINKYIYRSLFFFRFTFFFYFLVCFESVLSKNSFGTNEPTSRKARKKPNRTIQWMFIFSKLLAPELIDDRNLETGREKKPDTFNARITKKK